MLEPIAAAGWPVFAHVEPLFFVVALDDSLRFNIKHSRRSQTWIIEGYQHGQLRHHLSAADAIAIRSALVAAAKQHGYDLSASPSTLRLYGDTPISNRVGLVHLTAGASVEAAFDPYFDDKAVANVGILMNMGLRLAAVVRVLATSKGARRLSPTVLAEFETERQVRFDVRVCASDKEHRRFLLLKGGSSLVLGCSLNDLSKNEAAHTELNAQDLAFFEAQWSSAEDRNSAPQGEA